MTLSKTKPGGWGYAEVLTHDQITAIDENIEGAVDGRFGETDLVQSELTFSAECRFADNLELDGYVFVGAFGTIFMHNANFAGTIILPTKAVVGPASYIVDTTTYDYVIFVDPTGGAVTINLPAAVNGRTLVIKSVANSGTNNITLVRNGSDTIEAIAADYVMDADYQAVTLTAYSGGSWFITATA